MHLSEAVRIANERRTAAGRPIITVIQSKQSPEYFEVFRIMNEKLYENIRASLASVDRDDPKKVAVRARMANAGIAKPYVA